MLSKFIWFFIFSFLFCEKSLQTEQLKTSGCECGKLDDFVPRIVGGRNSEPDQHPWMVAILYKGSIHCGGTLINDRYILTAGHCIKFALKKKLSVVLGVHLLSELQNEKVQIPEIEDAFIHEQFSSSYVNDYEDIGLIKLKYPVEFTPFVKPICLPKMGANYGSEKAVVMGWGEIFEGAYPSLVLRETNVYVLTDEDCKKNPFIGNFVNDTLLCAYEDDTDACQGDSGGPLIYKSETGKMEQIGIVSWGLGCARPNIPGVYTKVTSYLEWIYSQTKGAWYCETPE